MSIYTMQQWKQDGTFSADPGQEISAEVYEQMLNTLPPEDLPRDKARQALQDYNIPVHAGFLMGEPHSSNSNGELLYMAFGRNNYGKGDRYFYLGLSIAEPETADGVYYFMDCLNAFVSDRLLPAGDFAGDADAIQTAANYEATLYKYEYRDGQRISSAVLYEPFACFENTTD